MFLWGPGCVLAEVASRSCGHEKGGLRVSKAQRRDILTTSIGPQRRRTSWQFARRTGLKYSTLANWVRTQSWRQTVGAAAPRLRLLEAVVESPPAAASGTLLVLQLPGGVRVEVADEKQAALAAMVVRELSKPYVELLPGSLKAMFVAVGACDMRKRVQTGLHALVAEHFWGRTSRAAARCLCSAISLAHADRKKSSRWDGTGIWVLEQATGARSGTFSWPKHLRTRNHQVAGG